MLGCLFSYYVPELEKEALVKGIPVGQALDIDIPPPRPKRKPSNPYPRKTGVGLISQAGVEDGKLITSASASGPPKQILDLEKEPIPDRPGGDDGSAKENHDDDNCSEVPTLFQEAPSTSVCSPSKNSVPSQPTPLALRSLCSFREFVPLVKNVSNHNETNESFVTVELKENQKLGKSNDKKTVSDLSVATNMENCHPSSEKIGKRSQPENFAPLPKSDQQASQNYPRHVSVHVLDGSLGSFTQIPPIDFSYRESMINQMRGVHGHPDLFTNAAASATTENQDNASRSSLHPSFPAFPSPFTPIHNNEDNYRSFLHVSSVFSSLIVSTLLQNPAAHAAASFAASFWPCANAEASGDSPAGSLAGFPSRHINPAPSMAAIAAATVAAATAWWAANGLLPVCAPFHTGFACPPATTTATPSVDDGQAPSAIKEQRENTHQDPPLKDQQLKSESSEALQAHNSASKLLTLSSSDSEESGVAKLDAGLTAADPEKKNAVVLELHDPNKTKSRKQVDRSSCGSNTPSSSEVETDALEKQGQEGLKEPDVNLSAGEPCNRRSRSISNLNDSWKEVSEEGRLAFQALFSREVLPQSFSPPHDLKNKGQPKHNIEEDKRAADEKANDASQLDLNSKMWRTCPCNNQEAEKITLVRVNSTGEDGLLSMGLGQGKLKMRRTGFKPYNRCSVEAGFKPYKRCSVEAMESRAANVCSSHGEEKCPKRIRLEGEALN